MGAALPGRAAVSPSGLKATAGGRWGPEVTHPAPAPATPGSRTEPGRDRTHSTWGQLAREGRGWVPERSPHARPHPGRQAGPSSRQAGWGRAPRGGGGVQPPGQAQRWAHPVPVPVPSASSCPQPLSALGAWRVQTKAQKLDTLVPNAAVGTRGGQARGPVAKRPLCSASQRPGGQGPDRPQSSATHTPRHRQIVRLKGKNGDPQSPLGFREGADPRQL